MSSSSALPFMSCTLPFITFISAVMAWHRMGRVTGCPHIHSSHHSQHHLTSSTNNTAESP